VRATNHRSPNWWVVAFLVAIACAASAARAPVAVVGENLNDPPGIHLGLGALSLNGPAPAQRQLFTSTTGHILICYSITGTQQLQLGARTLSIGSPGADLNISMQTVDGKRSIMDLQLSSLDPRADCVTQSVVPDTYAVSASAPSGDAWAVVVTELPVASGAVSPPDR
jgi:hypothetical protein